jgi:hypothetical protein
MRRSGPAARIPERFAVCSTFQGDRDAAPRLGQRQEIKMARKPATRAEFTLFDVIYEDGSQRSNRRVPSELLGGLDGDAPARTFIEEQDRLIAEKSSTPALAVKAIHRSGAKKTNEAVRSSRYASASDR